MTLAQRVLMLAQRVLMLAQRVLTLAQRVLTLAQRVLMLAQRELGGEDPADCRPCAATDGLHRPVLLSGDRPYAAIDIAIDIVALYI